MLASAVSAGFGTRATDTIDLIPDMDAGAMWALAPYAELDALHPLKVGICIAY